MGYRASFNDRMTASQNARKAMKAQFAAKSQAPDPGAAERRAARAQVAAARDERHREREARALQDKIQQAEQAAAEAAEKAETMLREAAERETREKDLLAEQKAARDARYAARKARRN
jgi:hypothetical protein